MDNVNLEAGDDQPHNTMTGSQDIISRAQRPEDIGWLQAGRGTCRKRGILHRHEEQLAFDVCKQQCSQN